MRHEHLSIGKRYPVPTLILAIAVSFVFGTALAQEKAQTNIKPGAAQDSPSARAVENIGLARQLATYGQEQESPLALLTAAQIQLENSFTIIKREKEEKAFEGEQAAGGGTKSAAAAPGLEPSELVAAAERMAGGDQSVLALCRELRSRMAAEEGTKGRVGGPVTHKDRVLARTKDIYKISFRGGELASVLITGDGDTDLDLYVYDENGNLIGSDTDTTDVCLVQWTPIWTGEFRIEIHNLGYVYNAYTLTTN